MQRRRLVARAVLGGLVPTMLALSIAPAIARANVNHYCVESAATPHVSCPTSGFTQVYQDIGSAVAVLASGDSLQIEPGTYAETPMVQNVAGVTIAGDPAQSAAPVITASTSSTTGGVFTVGAGADGLVLKHLEIDQTYPPGASYPADAVSIGSPATLDSVTINSTGRALQATRPVTLTNVSATVAPDSPPPPSDPKAAVNLDGYTGSMASSYGTIAATNLTVSASKFPLGVVVGNAAGVSLDGANITAVGHVNGELSAALEVTTATNGPIAVSHARLAGSVYGMFAEAGALTVSNTLATATGPAATDAGAQLLHLTSAGILVVPATAAGASMRNVTAIASDPSSAGIETNGALPGAQTLPAGSISVVNSIARGGTSGYDLLGAPSVASGSPGGVINVSYSNYRQASGDGTVPGLGVQSSDPGFVDVAGSNYHLQAGSPAIDAGTLVPSGDFDLDGMKRPDDRVGLPDLGAYEYPSPPPGAITGRLTDLAGQPIAGATVTVYDLSGNTVAAQVTGLAGTYTAAGLPPGSYHVGFAASGYDAQFYNGKSSLAAADPVVVAPDTTTTGIGASLSRSRGGIRGMVRNAKASAIAGATVTAYDASGVPVATASSDAAGAFEIDQLAQGAYRVGFSAGRYVPQFFNHAATLAQADPINVTGGSVSSGIDAVLVAGPSGPPFPRLRARTLYVSPSGSFSLALGGCPAQCHGTITVGASSAANRGKSSSSVVIARGRYKLARGKRAVITLHLNRAGARLRGLHQALLIAQVVLKEGSSTSTTQVRLVPASKTHH